LKNLFFVGNKKRNERKFLDTLKACASQMQRVGAALASGISVPCSKEANVDISALYLFGGQQRETLRDTLVSGNKYLFFVVSLKKF
jgi:hypothetical protein